MHETFAQFFTNWWTLKFVFKYIFVTNFVYFSSTLLVDLWMFGNIFNSLITLIDRDEFSDFCLVFEKFQVLRKFECKFFFSRISTITVDHIKCQKQNCKLINFLCLSKIKEWKIVPDKILCKFLLASSVWAHPAVTAISNRRNSWAYQNRTVNQVNIHVEGEQQSVCSVHTSKY